VVDSNRSGRGTLRRLRAKVTEALLGAGFKFDPEDLTRRMALRLDNASVLPAYPQPTVQLEGFRRSEPRRSQLNQTASVGGIG
jgi:hypothetical protein